MRGTKKIDWLNHFLEFIVVVIGILLAFQLNTCSENKKEATLIQQHITNIVEESEFNDSRMERSIEATQKSLETINSLFKLADDDKNTAAISEKVYELLRFEASYFKTTAFSSLKESGDIRFMQNFQLRDDIITLYEYYNWATGLDEAIADTYSTYFYPFVMKNMDMSAGLNQDPVIFKTIEFKNAITAYKYILQTRLAQNKDTQEKINSFLEKYGD